MSRNRLKPITKKGGGIDPKWQTTDKSGAARFKEGNPGRPKGSKSLTTQLKEKILNACMKIDLDGHDIRITRKGRKIKVRSVPHDTLLKVGASLVPKEVRANITRTNQTFIGVEVRKMETRDLNNDLVKRLSQRGARPIESGITGEDEGGEPI